MEVVRRDGESFEEMFQRYKRGMNRSGILKDVKRHRFYMSPGESRRLKKKMAAKRRRKHRRQAA